MKNIIILIGMMVLMSSLVLGSTVQLNFDKTKVSPGETLTLTYSQSEGKSYGLVQTIPTNWIASGVSADGKFRTYVDSGTDTVLTITAPSSTGSYNFDGEYFVYPSSAYTPFTSQVITVESNGNGGTPTEDTKSSMWIYVLIVGGIFGAIALSQK